MNTFAKLAYTSAAASALVMAMIASAQAAVNDKDIKAPTPYSAYVQDANGNIVRDAYGDCVHTGYWTPADATVIGCDGVVAKVAAPAPVAAPKAAVVAPKPAPTSEKVTFAADTLFDFDKSVLKPEGKAKLHELVAKLKDVNLEAVVATGHTDSIGTVAYNQKLSVRRAEAVKQHLVSHGVAADRIYISGKGKSQPVASNKTAAGRAQNRRVDIEVVGTRTVGGAAKEEVKASTHNKPHDHKHHDKHHGKHHDAKPQK